VSTVPNRILRESICYSETLARLSPDAERFFYRLTTQADDFGRFDARPSVLRSRCFQLGGVSDEDVAELLAALKKVGLICGYTLDGRAYGHFPTWAKYQRIRSPRSRYPEPPQVAASCGESPQVAADCGSPARASGSGSGSGSGSVISVPANTRVRTAPHPRATPWPEDFTLTEERASWGRDAGVEVAWEWNKFKDHALRDGATHKNWNAAWRYWIRNAVDLAHRRRG
jgi:hypothetical protein